MTVSRDLPLGVPVLVDGQLADTYCRRACRGVDYYGLSIRGSKRLIYRRRAEFVALGRGEAESAVRFLSMPAEGSA